MADIQGTNPDKKPPVSDAIGTAKPKAADGKKEEKDKPEDEDGGSEMNLGMILMLLLFGGLAGKSGGFLSDMTGGKGMFGNLGAMLSGFGEKSEPVRESISQTISNIPSRVAQAGRSVAARSVSNGLTSIGQYAKDAWTTVAGTDAEKDELAYRSYLKHGGVDKAVLDGAMAAGKETGLGFRSLMKISQVESSFGQAKANNASSASALPKNYFQITDGTKSYLNKAYGAEAQAFAQKNGTTFNPHSEWRTDPLISAFMAGKYLKEAGPNADDKQRYAFYFSGNNKLAALAKDASTQNIALANTPEFRAAARSNPTLFYKGGIKSAENALPASDVYARLTGKIGRAESDQVAVAKSQFAVASAEPAPGSPSSGVRLATSNSGTFVKPPDAKTESSYWNLADRIPATAPAKPSVAPAASVASNDASWITSMQHV